MNSYTLGYIVVFHGGVDCIFKSNLGIDVILKCQILKSRDIYTGYGGTSLYMWDM